MPEAGKKPAPGDRLGPYLLLEEIGTGGQGTVFEALVVGPGEHDTVVEPVLATPGSNAASPAAVVDTLGPGITVSSAVPDQHGRAFRPASLLVLPRDELVLTAPAGALRPASLWDRYRGERRALKVLHPGWADQEGRALLEDEASIGRHLGNNPGCENIVATFGCGTDGGYSYLEMELIKPCINLYQAWDLYRQRGVQISSFHALQVAVCILNALDYAHRKIDLIHRDVKPGNILLGAGTVKLTDFGISRSRLNLQQSIPGVNFKGTLGYAAPEQFQPDAEVDARADQYSVAVILFELLTMTGFREPHRELDALGSRIDLLHTHCRDDRCVPALKRALASNPADRFPTSAAFREALLECLDIIPEYDSFSSWINAVCQGKTPGMKMGGPRIAGQHRPVTAPLEGPLGPGRAMPPTVIAGQAAISGGRPHSVSSRRLTRGTISRRQSQRLVSPLLSSGFSRWSVRRRANESLSLRQRKWLRSILCRLFTEPDQIRLVAHDAGIDLRRINMSGPSEIIWQNILDEVRTQGVPATRALLHEVRKRKKHPELLRFINAYETAHRSGNTREEGPLPPPADHRPAPRPRHTLVNAMVFVPLLIGVVSLERCPRTSQAIDMGLKGISTVLKDTVNNGRSGPGVELDLADLRRKAVDIQVDARIRGAVNIVLLDTDASPEAVERLKEFLTHFDPEGRTVKVMEARHLEFLNHAAPFLTQAAKPAWKAVPALCWSRQTYFTDLVQRSLDRPQAEAENLLVQAWSAFTCGQEWVDNEGLSDFTFQLALRHLRRDHNDDALFARLCTIAPRFELPGKYDNFIKSAFFRRAHEVSLAPFVRVELDHELLRGYQLWVDGEPIKSGTLLREGEHYGQLVSTETRLAYAGAIVKARRDRPLRLPTPELTPPTPEEIVDDMRRVTLRTGPDNQLHEVLRQRFSADLAARQFIIQVLAATREDGCSFDLLVIHHESRTETGLTLVTTPYTFTAGCGLLK